MLCLYRSNFFFNGGLSIYFSPLVSFSILPSFNSFQLFFLSLFLSFALSFALSLPLFISLYPFLSIINSTYIATLYLSFSPSFSPYLSIYLSIFVYLYLSLYLYFFYPNVSHYISISLFCFILPPSFYILSRKCKMVYLVVFRAFKLFEAIVILLNDYF